MLKQIAALTVFAGLALGATDSHAGGVLLHPPGLGPGSTIPSGCTNARSLAISAGRTNRNATAQCTLSTDHGNVNVIFDYAGMAIRGWTYDAQGIGHYYIATRSLAAGVRIDRKNYHGPRLEGEVAWYTTLAQGPFHIPGPAPVVGNDPERPDSFAWEGHTFYKRQDHRIVLNPELGEWRFINTLFTAAKTYQDSCVVWTHGAESTAPGVTPRALVAHFDADGTQHEKYFWDGQPIDYTQFSCGSYLPTAVNFVKPNQALFLEEQNAFGFSAAANTAFVTRAYARYGGDYNANPLSIFPIAHTERLSFGVHPLTPPHNDGWLGDGWTPHAQGILDSSLNLGGWGALGGLIGGGPLGMTVGFVGGFFGTYSAAVITDLDNGIDPRTGEPLSSQLDLPAVDDDELISAEDEELIADWDGNANDPFTEDPSGSEQDPSGGALDGAGDFLDGDNGGDSCGTNANACFPQARVRAPR